MIKFRKHTRRTVPMLNTASLPDLIFTVLFFFMIVTHMRNESVKVDYQKPQGTELTKLTKKSSHIYIHIGKQAGGDNYLIQMNDKIINLDDLANYVSNERGKMTPEEQQQSTVSIKADKHTPMSVIMDVKRALREAKAYKISYSGEIRIDKES